MSDVASVQNPSPKPAAGGQPAERTVGRHFLEFFGSLKLAMVLLAILIGACIVGTLAESRFDTAVAQAYVYDSPWFIAWLILLCLNLICSALVRYPWEKRLTGFVITHAGIVVILLGAIIGRIWGIEGNITLFKGDQPVNFIVGHQKLIEVRTGNMKQGEFHVLPIDVRPPTPERPIEFSVDGVKVEVIGFTEDLGVKTLVEAGEGEGAPAIQFQMQSAMVPQPIEQWLVLGDPDRSRADLGLAEIRLVADDGATGPASSRKNKAVAAGRGEPAREMHFVFAKMPEMGITRSIAGGPTGVSAVYRFEGGGAPKGGKGVLRLEAEGNHHEFAVASLLGKTVPLKGTPWSVKVLEYFADFRMEGKKPVSVSDEPNNPALVLEISGIGEARASSPDESPANPHGHAHGSGPMGTPGKSTVTVFYGPQGNMRFKSFSKKYGTREAAIEPGKEVQLGWADWRFQVQKVIPSAAIREELAPMSEGPYRSTGTAGLKIKLGKNGETISRWISLGNAAHFQLGGESVHAFFGQRIHPLEFSLVLDDFEVERDEGTMNPAGFKSRVRFLDDKNKQVVEREVWMNNPATYPEFPGAALLGTSYKFSQASWNPNDLSQTTLQVLRDPGWSLKWIGSLMLCGGLFTMFYLVPYSRKKETA